MIHREGQKMMPRGDGSWTVWKRGGKEMEQKEQGRTGYYSGDALLRQPFWILRDWNTSLSTGKVPLSSASCLPHLCHPIFGPGQPHNPKPKGLRYGTLEAFQALALWQGSSVLTGMLLSLRLLAIPNITPGGRCTSSRNTSTSSVWHSQRADRRSLWLKWRGGYREGWGEGDRSYCTSGLYLTSNRGSLNRSKQEVTSESSVRKVILVVAEMTAFKELREKKETEPSPGRQLRGHCSHPSEKLRKAQFQAWNSSYWSCHSRNLSL